MKSKLNIYTSYVTEDRLKMFIEENYLPIFVLRSIGNSQVIGKYNGTPVHLIELAPSSLLYQTWRDKKIDLDEYKRNYAIEMCQTNFQEIIKKLEIMSDLCNAKGVVLLGFSQDPEYCHRSVLASLLNNSGLLEKEIIEYDIK